MSVKGTKPKHRDDCHCAFCDPNVNKGSNNPFYGKKHTDEFRIFISQKLTGSHRTPEQRKIMSAAQVGHGQTKFPEDLSVVLDRCISDEVQGCWLYPSTRKYSYVYEKMVGPIPTGMVLDHLCGNGASQRFTPGFTCVNPDHLDPCTKLENSLRGGYPHFELRGRNDSAL